MLYEPSDTRLKINAFQFIQLQELQHRNHIKIKGFRWDGDLETLYVFLDRTSASIARDQLERWRKLIAPKTQP